MIKKLEKQIIGKMLSIKSGKISPKDSGIGTLMFKLKELDEIAYVRFASVYRQFKDINTFIFELQSLLKDQGTKRKA